MHKEASFSAAIKIFVCLRVTKTVFGISDLVRNLPSFHPVTKILIRCSHYGKLHHIVMPDINMFSLVEIFSSVSCGPFCWPGALLKLYCRRLLKAPDLRHLAQPFEVFDASDRATYSASVELKLTHVWRRPDAWRVASSNLVVIPDLKPWYFLSSYPQLASTAGNSFLSSLGLSVRRKLQGPRRSLKVFLG